MSPPGLTAPTQPAGGTTTRDALTAHQMQAMLRAAHRALTDGGDRVVTPAKINRLVRRFGHRLRRAHLSFDEFLSLPPQRQRAALGDPELLCVIAYADRTGEDAVNHVLAQRGW